MSHERNISTATAAGLAYGVLAYTWWGLAPIYFKLVDHVAPVVVLAHRIVWSCALLVVILLVMRRWPRVPAALRDRRVMGTLCVSTVLIAINWLVFIYAVAADRVVDASLGYFINPLFMVALGMVFLGERLRALQWTAVALAAAGLVWLSLAREGLPWIALVLPASFGSYSLMRKRANVGPLAGLFIETMLLAPVAVAFLVWVEMGGGFGDAVGTGTGEAGADGAAEPGRWATLGLLSLAGIVTTAPLLWFVAGVQRLSLASMGFLQYLSPSIQFAIGVAVFGEALGRDRVVTFGLTWLALGLFIADAVRQTRAARRRLARSAVPPAA